MEQNVLCAAAVPRSAGPDKSIHAIKVLRLIKYIYLTYIYYIRYIVYRHRYRHCLGFVNKYLNTFRLWSNVLNLIDTDINYASQG